MPPRAIMFFVACALIAFLGAFFFWTHQATTPVIDNDCPPPPVPYLGNEGNIKVILHETLGVFSAQTTPKVLVNLPDGVYHATTPAYLVCKGRQLGHIKTDEQARYFTEFFGFLMTKPTADQILQWRKQGQGPASTRPNVVGSLRNVELHFQANVSTQVFALTLDRTKDPRIDDFWVNETEDETTPLLFAKICRIYTQCLSCDPAPDRITNSVRISISGPLAEKTVDGTKAFVCAP